MVVDPILRFNWIFYMIYAHELQTSSMVAFLIALTEVLRRGLWTLFRVENEHCNNVGRFRASRDVPLPYDVGDEDTQEMLKKTPEDITQPPGAAKTSQQSSTPGRPRTSQTMPIEHLGEDATRTTGTDLEHGYSAESPESFRRRHPSLTNSPIARALRQAGNTMRSAHAQDYERKRKPENESGATDNTKDDDDDDDDDISSDSDDDTGRQQPRGPRHHVERERRNSSEEDGRGDLAEAEDLVSRARSGNK